MVRDSREVMVSAYFYATKHKHRLAGDIAQFLDDPDQGIANLARYLNGWARGLRQPHFVLCYEKLQANPEQQTEKALRFLGCKVDADALSDAVRSSHFGPMCELERTGGIPDHDYDRSDEDSLRMRRGKAGGFTDYLRQADVSFIKRTLALKLFPEARVLVRETGLDVAS